ncbi:MAG: HmuY family protein [Chitinophagaceae bacterium]
MKNLKKSLVALIAIATFTSCKKEDTAVTVDTTNNGSFKVFTIGNITTVQNLMADTIIGFTPIGQPFGANKFTFFSIVNKALVPSTDSATTKWDIGFKGTTIIVNNGTSGPGNGGGFTQVGLFDEVRQVSNDSTIRVDNAPNYAIAFGSNRSWYVYNAPTNLITPIPGRTLIIRTANGNFAKLEILNYYKGGTTPAATAPDAVKLKDQRYYTFRFTYQSNGSKIFP